MTLSSYVRVFRERWRLIAFVMVIAVGLAVLLTALTPKSYTADAQVFVTANSQPTAQSGQYDQQAAALAQTSTFAQLIQNPKIITGVKQDLNLNLSDSELEGKLSATAPVSQALVIIHATDGNASNAAAIANSAARQFSVVIERLVTPSGSRVPLLRLEVTLPATAPSAPTSPKSVVNVTLGLLLGLLLGASLAIARDVLDNRVKDVEVLAKTAKAAVMGIIVEDSDASRHPVATQMGRRSIRAENFRQLRANLQFANVDRHPRVIAVTSSVSNEGKTMVALNLAHSLAEAGFTVCLVDADLRRPTVAKVLGIPGAVGLTSVLIQQVALDEALQNAASNLLVLCSGPIPPNPSEVLASSYVREVIHSLLERVDYVVLDTAPLLPVSDGSEVAALADGTLLVARHNSTTESQVKRSAESLGRVGATVVGVLLNRVPSKRKGPYAYTYYQEERRADGKGATQQPNVKTATSEAGLTSVGGRSTNKHKKES